MTIMIRIGKGARETKAGKKRVGCGCCGAEVRVVFVVVLTGDWRAIEEEHHNRDWKSCRTWGDEWAHGVWGLGEESTSLLAVRGQLHSNFDP